MTCTSSPSLSPSTPISPPRRLSLRRSTPFLNPFESPLLHLQSGSQVPSPATLFDPSPSLSFRSASLGVAYLAERRAVDLIKVLDLAGLGVAFEGGKRLDLNKEEERLASPLFPRSPRLLQALVVSQSSSPSQPGLVMSAHSYHSAVEHSGPRTPTSPPPPAPESGTPGPHSKPLPPVGQSFMRWSMTASTIFSEQSAFYYEGKRSTGQFSEFSPVLPETSASSPPSNQSSGLSGNMSHPPTSAPAHVRPEAKRRESTNSAGTFGSRQRRWSAVHSIASVPASSPSTDFGPATTHPFDETGQADDEDPKSGSIASRPKFRRPLSMSSASDSTFSGAPYANTNSERVHIGRSSIPAATFPSPTLRRPAHKTPESEAEITAHLLKASGRNESCIVPRLLPPFSPTKPGPTVGTPIDVEVREESSTCGDSENGGKRRDRRKTSKLDQILGEGAETARVLMEFDRRAIEDVVDMPGMTRLPPPPRHKPSASVPCLTSIPILPPSTPANSSPSRSRFSRTEHICPSPSRGRSNSLDSIPSSLNPSLADSTHTMARLLPAQTLAPTYPIPRVPQYSDGYRISNLQKPEARNNLSPEQRAMLVRRTRKIEHLLGEPLGELRISQHVVGPSTALTAVLTSHETDWPSSPSSGTCRTIPEYDRQDCLPRTVKLGDRPVPLTTTAGKGGGSKMALKAMTALGLGSGEEKREEEDLRVYVKREKTVAELVWRGYQWDTSGNTRTSQESGMQYSLESPRSPTEDVWEDEEDVARRARRMQVAKLNRLLGVPVPSSALQSHHPCPSTSPSPANPKSARPNPAVRANSASDLSFISFEDDPPSTSWTKRMRSVVNGNKDKERERAFWDSEKDKYRDRAKRGSSPRGGNGFFGKRDGVEGSFMDMKDAKKVNMPGFGGKERSGLMRKGSEAERV